VDAITVRMRMNQEHPERFQFVSDDDESRNLTLVIDYQTFLALGFDGYHAEDLRAFIHQSLEQGKIAVEHQYPNPPE
jgi:hypothetical protein